jgi:putative SOS response-associated peptidase YedK
MEAFYLDQQPALEDSGRRMQASPLALRFMHRVHPPRSQGEIHPGHVIPVMARDRLGRNTIFPMQWGITIPPEPGKEAGSFLKLLRVENLARDSFRDLAEHRCIIPFSYYFETEPGQERRTILQPSGQDLGFFAGVYHLEDGLPFFLILTREAVENVAYLGANMPLMLPSYALRSWTDPQKAVRPFLADPVVELITEPE